MTELKQLSDLDKFIEEKGFWSSDVERLKISERVVNSGWVFEVF